MLKLGKYHVTAITREGSSSKIPDGVSVAKVNYDEPQTLIKALEGHDVLIVSMSVTAPKDSQTKIIEAAFAAKVPWILPNEFGGDAGNPIAGKESLIGPAKEAQRELIASKGKGTTSYIGIACSFWYEWSLCGGEARYGFDIPNRKVTFFDDGNTKINTTTWPQLGRGVANLLAFKILPDDAADKSPSLSDYRNKFVRISSFRMSQRDMLDVLNRTLGTKTSDWTTKKVPAKEMHERGKEMLFKEGNQEGFSWLLYSRLFYNDGSGDFEKRAGIDNEKLGLPKEDPVEAARYGLKLAEEGALAY